MFVVMCIVLVQWYSTIHVRADMTWDFVFLIMSIGCKKVKGSTNWKEE